MTPTANVMKAIVQHGYGTADVLKLEDVDMPAVADDRILVRIRAASVNALDWHVTRGKPYFMRLMTGLRVPSDKIRGVDFAGEVVSVGRNVTRTKPGDAVLGRTDGSFAEYTATPEEWVVPKPAGVTWEQAASLNVAGLTSLQGLRDRAQLRRGQSALIVGAGGGVGTFAVQIAKWLGARVVAVTRTESVDLVRGLGADDVIDYRKEDFTRLGERFDVIFDIGGPQPFRHYRRIMNRNAVCVAIGGPAKEWFAPADRMLKAIVLSPFVTQRFLPFVAQTNSADRTLLAELVEQGKLTPVIDRRYALRDAVEAVRYVGEGHARGKVIVTIA